MSSQNPLNVVFDDLEAAVDALEVGVDFLEQAETNAQRLRWAIIAIHQALQCFMVTALRDTAGSRPLRQDSAKRFVRELSAYEAGGAPFPSQQQRLRSFLKLYAKVRDASPAGMGTLVSGKAFEAEAEDDRAICNLNKLRNRFVHFTPGSWVLDPVVAIRALCSGLKVISFLAFESQNVLWAAHGEATEIHTKELISRGGEALGRLSAVYIREL